MDLQDLKTLDDLADEAGGYVMYFPEYQRTHGVDMKALNAYCAEKGIEPLDLTGREYNSFIKKRRRGLRLAPIEDVKYDIRKLSKYIRDNNLDSLEMTERELQQFLFD